MHHIDEMKYLFHKKSSKKTKLNENVNLNFLCLKAPFQSNLWDLWGVVYEDCKKMQWKILERIKYFVINTAVIDTYIKKSTLSISCPHYSVYNNIKLNIHL